MHRLLIMLLLVAISPALIAQQNLDSLHLLIKISKQKHDYLTVGRALSSLAAAYNERGDWDSATFYTWRAIHNNMRLNNDTLLSSNYNDLGVIHYHKGNYDSTLHYYGLAVEKAKSADDLSRAGVLLYNISAVYKKQGWLDRALEYNLEAVRINEKVGLPKNLASVYAGLASLYGQLEEFDKALEYNQRALSLRIQLNDKRLTSHSYNNLGNTFKSLKQYDSALHYFLLALDIKKAIKDKTIGSTVHNIGTVMLAMNDYTRAESYFQEALKLKHDQNDKDGEVESLLSLAELKQRQQQPAASIPYLSRAELLAAQLGAQTLLSRVYHLMASAYSEGGQYVKAFQYHVLFQQMQDTLLNAEKVKVIGELQTQFETEKKEQLIASLQLDREVQQARLERQQLWNRGLTWGAILLGIIIMLGAGLLLQTRRHARMKETLLKELNHRVKNNLQLLSSLFSLQAQVLTDQSAIQTIKSSEGRVNTMAIIHQRLYQSDDVRHVNMKSFVVELVNYLSALYGYASAEIMIDAEDMKLDVDKAIPLGLITNELVSNAFKYAFADQDKPCLRVVLHRQKEHLMLCVQDNGTGLNLEAARQQKSSFGLRMVSMLTRELKGRMDVQTTSGTVFTIQIPY